jgi:hypothetical protein
MTLLTFWKRFISCRASELFRSGQGLDVTFKHVHRPFRKTITALFSFFR